MRLAWGLAVLVASPALALGPDGGCPAVAEPFATLRSLVQSDAGQPGDAPDCRGDARDLALQDYTWGLVEPAGAQGSSDIDDWFTQDLTAAFGGEAWVLLNMSIADPAYYAAGLPLPPVPVLHQPFRLEAFPPGAAVPAATLTSCTGGVWLVWPAAGSWDFHVRQLGPSEALPCLSAALPGPTGAPPAGATYGIYKGCKPHCTVTADGTL